MLTRRHLRIKVFQAIYAFQYDGSKGLLAAEKHLKKSIDDIYRLYLYELSTLVLVHRFAKERIEINRQKKLATAEDINPNTRFIDNRYLNWLANSLAFQKDIQDYHISFGDDKEIIRSLYKAFIEDERYQEYMDNDEDSLAADKKIIKYLYGAYIVENETLQQVYEDHNMFWSDDLDAAQAMAAKTISSFDASKNEQSKLQRLIKNQDDMDFALQLFRTAIKENDKLEERILAKAQHWEGDRIAVVDNIFLKMGLAELMTFNQIPVKVTLNEYIELAKQYSTKKSGQFINGILDKLKTEMMESGEVRKIGRGLL